MGAVKSHKRRKKNLEDHILTILETVHGIDYSMDALRRDFSRYKQEQDLRMRGSVCMQEKHYRATYRLVASDRRCGATDYEKMGRRGAIHQLVDIIMDQPETFGITIRTEESLTPYGPAIDYIAEMVVRT
jgi:hypothetical protein